MPNLVIQGRDIIAGILIVGCICLLGTGHNHMVEWILLGVSSAYGFIYLPISKLKGK